MHTKNSVKPADKVASSIESKEQINSRKNTKNANNVPSKNSIY